VEQKYTITTHLLFKNIRLRLFFTTFAPLFLKVDFLKVDFLKVDFLKVDFLKVDDTIHHEYASTR
jgi:hypothetical protein